MIAGYAALVQMSRCMCLSDEPPFKNSPPSQSSNSECDGLSPPRPKSLGVVTMPWPKW